MSERRTIDPVDIMVVGAAVELDGIVSEVVAVAPPEAATLASNPELFEVYGDIAITHVKPNSALRESGRIANDILEKDATQKSMMHSRAVGSVALVGVVPFSLLQQRTTQNLR
ncbi:MAG: hypothetical protein ABIQ64_04695 [Candidatus Saccharimonadales bacterium]